MSGFGVARCSVREIEPATDGLVCIVDRKHDIAEYFDRNNIAYRKGGDITIRGQKYHVLLKTNAPKVAVLSSPSENAKQALCNVGWNVFDINALTDEIDYQSFLSLYEAI